MKRIRLRQIMRIVLLLASGLLTMCSPSTPTPEPDRVILQLSWNHEAEFAGYYVAHEKGFYADENLEVTIREGGFPVGIAAAQALANQDVDLAVLSFERYKNLADSEAVATVVMAAQQISPQVLFALSDSGIQKPQDMVGRRVAVKAAGWRKMIHDTLTNAGVDPAEIIEVEVESNAIEMLYNGEVDVWSGFAHNEPIQAQLAGYDLNLIYTADYGVGAYEGLLSVHLDTLEQNPDLVARFVRASLRGWRYAIEHPDEAAEIIFKWQPANSLEFHRLAMRAMIPLVDTGYVPIGWIEAERWQMAMGDAYDAERPGYTMWFVEAAQE